ncbi:MAG: multicopper oxidase domain-containing protein, partial [Myxococcales bacterium]|nr:multicopper oxidase domain-containing protein [Myxococcales bacterium]
DATAPGATEDDSTTGPPPGTTTGPDVTTSTSGPDTTADGTTTTEDDSSSSGGPTGEYGGNIIIPELLPGPDFELVMDEGTHTFTAGGSPSSTAGYNGGLLGPTLEWVQGQSISITITNELDRDSTTHWHGAHVSPANDGGPHQMIAAGGGTWSPSFEVLNAAATMWYHPHLHEDTANQVRLGLSGFIIVRDDVEAALDLPRTYGVDDLPLVLQDKQLDGDGVLQMAPDRGNTMTVNGAADAFREVPAQLVRLRLLNGSLELAYSLAFADGRTFDVIGNDLGLLGAPAPVTSLVIAPGERYEVVIDLSGDEGGSVTLRALNTDLPMGVIGGTQPMMQGIEGTDFDVIRFDVVAPTSDATTALPAVLVPPEIPSEAGASPRSMVMANAVPPAMGFTLNGAEMDMAVINEYVEEGAVEIWTLENTTMLAHPFHIHDIHFHILDIDADGAGPMQASAPEAWQAGPKDTVLVPGGAAVRFIGQFSDFAVDPTGPGGNADAAYMYHCHILPHEDGGMMGQFAVCPAASGTCPPP